MKRKLFLWTHFSAVVDVHVLRHSGSSQVFCAGLDRIRKSLCMSLDCWLTRCSHLSVTVLLTFAEVFVLYVFKGVLLTAAPNTHNASI